MNGLDGRPRVTAGRLRFAQAPELGTILGPKDVTREYVVVLGQDDDGATVVGYATPADFDAMRQRRTDGLPPRSVAEWAVPW